MYRSPEVVEAVKRGDPNIGSLMHKLQFNFNVWLKKCEQDQAIASIVDNGLKEELRAAHDQAMMDKNTSNSIVTSLSPETPDSDSPIISRTSKPSKNKSNIVEISNPSPNTSHPPAVVIVKNERNKNSQWLFDLFPEWHNLIKKQEYFNNDSMMNVACNNIVPNIEKLEDIDIRFHFTMELMADSVNNISLEYKKYCKDWIDYKYINLIVSKNEENIESKNINNYREDIKIDNELSSDESSESAVGAVDVITNMNLNIVDTRPTQTEPPKGVFPSAQELLLTSKLSGTDVNNWTPSEENAFAIALRQALAAQNWQDWHNRMPWIVQKSESVNSHINTNDIKPGDSFGFITSEINHVTVEKKEYLGTVMFEQANGGFDWISHHTQQRSCGYWTSQMQDGKQTLDFFVMLRNRICVDDAKMIKKGMVMFKITPKPDFNDFFIIKNVIGDSFEYHRSRFKDGVYKMKTSMFFDHCFGCFL